MEIIPTQASGHVNILEMWNIPPASYLPLITVQRCICQLQSNKTLVKVYLERQLARQMSTSFWETEKRLQWLVFRL